DHAVVAQIQAFGLDHLARRGIGTDVEAEDHGIGRQRQVGIGLGDTAHATGYDLDLDFVVAQLVQRALQCLQRTAHVGLDDDIERLLLALAHVLEHVLQLGRLLTGQLDLAELALAEQRDFPRLLLVSHHGHLVTRFRGAIQAEDRDGNGRAGFLHQVAVFVKHGTHPAVVQAGQHHVALTQGTVLDQYGGNRATALVQPRLDDHTAGRSRGLGLELEYLGLQQDRFQQIVDTGTDLGRYVDKLGVAAPLFRDDIPRSEIVLDAIRIGAFLVDLVPRDDQRNARGLGMLHRFFGLRHDAIIGCHHQDHDIGGLGTTGTHGGKRRVAGGVQEGDHAAIRFHMVGTDVLGDTTRFTGGHLGAADVVEQRGLAMVNVTHDGHHRRTADFFALEVHGLGQAVFQIAFLDVFDLVAHVFGYDGRGVLIQHLVDRHHVAVLEHVLDDLGRLHRHLLGQFGHGDGFTDYHFSHYGSCRLLEAVLITFFLRLELAGTTTTTRQGVLVFTARSATALAGATSALAAALVFIGPGLATLLFFLLRGSGR